MVIMVTEKPQKNPRKYECTDCNYDTSNKKDYSRHLMTAKHTMVQNGIEKTPSKPHYICALCKKNFRYSSGLSRHTKTCKPTVIPIVQPVQRHVKLKSTHADVDSLMDLLKQNQDFKELLIEQQTENKLFKELIIEQQFENQKLQSKLIEAVKDTGNTYNNNSTTNNNQKFNLNFFLNTTCKDAMNMTEFIENIRVDFKDIENIGKNGYVTGMTDMILSRIKELDVTKRPLHCTDLKRETMYIKDNDEWSKDTPDNTKLHQMIDYVAKRNYAKIPLWRDNHPECQQWDHPQYEFCVSMMRNILGDVGTEQIRLDNKVIKNLSRHVLVEKQG